MSDEAPASSKTAGGSKKLIVTLLVLLALLLVGCGVLFVRYQAALSSQPKTDAERIARITALLNKTVQLPNEEPTIATVTDTNKLAEPQLAAQAKNGDELLVYAEARRVILYRPSEEKVVDMFRIAAPESGTTIVQPQTAGEDTTR